MINLLFRLRFGGFRFRARLLCVGLGATARDFSVQGLLASCCRLFLGLLCLCSVSRRCGFCGLTRGALAAFLGLCGLSGCALLLCPLLSFRNLPLALLFSQALTLGPCCRLRLLASDARLFVSLALLLGGDLALLFVVGVTSKPTSLPTEKPEVAPEPQAKKPNLPGSKEDTDQWVAEFRKAMTDADVEASWSGVCDLYESANVDIPLEIEAEMRMAYERIAQK